MCVCGDALFIACSDETGREVREDEGGRGEGCVGVEGVSPREPIIERDPRERILSRESLFIERDYYRERLL